MINIKMMQVYLGNIHSENSNIVNNIFLANNESTSMLMQITYLFPLKTDILSQASFPPF